MAKSSGHFAPALKGAGKHNFRLYEPNYLVPKQYRKNNQYWNLATGDKRLASEQEFKDLLRKTFNENLPKVQRGKKPELEKNHEECILNLNENHTLNDVKKAAAFIENYFGVVCVSIAIHRDEGAVDENGKMLFNEDGSPHLNYHAHLNFITYKEGKNNKSKMYGCTEEKKVVKDGKTMVVKNRSKKFLSDFQTELAKIMGMERGEIWSKAIYKSHQDYKKEQEIKRQKIEAEKQKKLALKVEAKAMEIKKDAEAKNIELENSIKVLTDSKATLENSNAELEKKNQSLLDSNANLDEEIKSKTKTLNQANADLADVRENLKTLAKEQADWESQKTERETFNTDFKKLQKDYEELNEKYSQKFRWSSKLDDEIKEKESILEILEKKLFKWVEPFRAAAEKWWKETKGFLEKIRIPTHQKELEIEERMQVEFINKISDKALESFAQNCFNQGHEQGIYQGKREAEKSAREKLEKEYLQILQDKDREVASRDKEIASLKVEKDQQLQMKQELKSLKEYIGSYSFQGKNMLDDYREKQRAIRSYDYEETEGTKRKQK